MISCCAYCKHLDKTRYESLDNGVKQRLYGCSKRANGNVVGWVQGDNELKSQGGSCFELGIEGVKAIKKARIAWALEDYADEIKSLEIEQLPLLNLIKGERK